MVNADVGLCGAVSGGKRLGKALYFDPGRACDPSPASLSVVVCCMVVRQC